MKKSSEFYNNLNKELDAKYYPFVKYYGENPNTVAIHRATELFNNGCLTYDKLIERLAKACDETRTSIHEIVSKHIEDFEGYEYDTTTVRKRFKYEGIELRIVERDETCDFNSSIISRLTRVLAPNDGVIPLSINYNWTLKKVQQEATNALDNFKSMGADVKAELTKYLSKV